MQGFENVEVESTDPELQEIEIFLKELLAEEGIPAASTRHVAEEIGVSLRVARRRLFKLQGRGIVRRKDGPGYVWYLPKITN